MDRIPIISLSGSYSLSNIYNDLPLPSSTLTPLEDRTLLTDNKAAHDAFRCVNNADPVLVSTVSDLLGSISTDEFLFDEQLSLTCDKPAPVPKLFTHILSNVPDSLRYSLDCAHLKRALDDHAEAISNTSYSSGALPEKDAYKAVSIAPLKLSLRKKLLISTDSTEIKKNKHRRKKNQVQNPVLSSEKTEAIRPDVIPSSCSVVLTPLDSAQPIETQTTVSIFPSALTSEFQSVSISKPSDIVSPLKKNDAPSLVPSHVSTSVPISIASTTIVTTTTFVSSTSHTTEPISIAPTVTNNSYCIANPNLSLFGDTGFFPCVPHCDAEEEQNGGGGLFDTCTEPVLSLTPSKPSSEIVTDSTSTANLNLAASAPSSVLPYNAAPAKVLPQQTSLNQDSISCLTRCSPQSLLSGYSSYPATPVNPTLTIMTGLSTHSPACLLKSQQQHHQPSIVASSPSARLFDNLDNNDDQLVEPSSAHSQPDGEDRHALSRPSHYGLAAYLPRSHSGLSVNVASNEPDTVGREESPNSESGKAKSRQANSSKSGKQRSYAAGKGSNGKPKDTMNRRRLTEVEKLKGWTVTDLAAVSNANAGDTAAAGSSSSKPTTGKLAPPPPLDNTAECRDKPSYSSSQHRPHHHHKSRSQIPVKCANRNKPNASGKSSSSSSPRGNNSNKSSISSRNRIASRSGSRSSSSNVSSLHANNNDDDDDDDDECFTEALVERVKRRRQQREQAQIQQHKKPPQQKRPHHHSKQIPAKTQEVDKKASVGAKSEKKKQPLSASKDVSGYCSSSSPCSSSQPSPVVTSSSMPSPARAPLPTQPASSSSCSQLPATSTVTPATAPTITTSKLQTNCWQPSVPRRYRRSVVPSKLSASAARQHQPNKVEVDSGCYVTSAADKVDDESLASGDGDDDDDDKSPMRSPPPIEDLQVSHSSAPNKRPTGSRHPTPSKTPPPKLVASSNASIDLSKTISSAHNHMSSSPANQTAVSPRRHSLRRLSTSAGAPVSPRQPSPSSSSSDLSSASSEAMSTSRPPSPRTRRIASPVQEPQQKQQSDNDAAVVVADDDDDQCSTLSTIPYTHSSAMETEGDNEDDEMSDDAVTTNATASTTKNSRHRLGNKPALDSTLQPEEKEEEEVHSEDEEEAPGDEHRQLLEPPGSLSDVDAFSDVDIAAALSDEQSTYTHNLAKLKDHLDAILSRVEEIDLLLHSSPGCSSNQLPEQACLNRRELLMLLYETQEVRLGGLLYSMPMGRLVRLLTLLLANMRQAASAPIPTRLQCAELDRSAKRRSSSNSTGSSSPNVTNESLLWTNKSCWARLLGDLECARIALNILVSPDMPRQLLMEDLIESILSLVKRLLDHVVCSSATEQSNGPRRKSAASSPVYNLVVECIGYRVALLMAFLTNLIRFQPNRLTDNLVFHLTSLALSVSAFYLTNDARPSPGFSDSVQQLYKATHIDVPNLMMINNDDQESGRSDNANHLRLTARLVRPSKMLLANWRLVLHRASLSLIGLLYGQYESHRKSILEEMFNTLVQALSPQTVGGNNAASCNDEAEVEDAPQQQPVMISRKLVRSFRLLNSTWLYESDQLTSNCAHQSSTPFIKVTSVSVLFMALTQGTLQPQTNCAANSSTATAAGQAGSRRPSASSSSVVHAAGGGGDSSAEQQFAREEKLAVSGYADSRRLAQHLATGLFKRALWKNETDLRPLLDTFVNDLLTVAFASPVEWPSSALLLQALTNMLVQHLTDQSATESRAAGAASRLPASKMLAVDLLTVIGTGLSAAAARSLQPSAAAGADTVEHARRLTAYLASKLSAMQHWLVEPPTGDASIEQQQLAWRDEIRALRDPRLINSDCLVLSAQRFYLTHWLYLAYSRDSSSANSDKKQPTDQRRRQLLGELSLSNHACLTAPAWLTSDLIGQDGLRAAAFNSPTSSSARCSVNNPTSSSAAAFNQSVPPGSLLLYSPPNDDKFLRLVHSPVLTPVADRNILPLVRRLGAHAHFSAVQLAGSESSGWSSASLPSFELIFSVMCKLINDTSIPLRCKAIRSLASLLESNPNLLRTRCKQPVDPTLDQQSKSDNSKRKSSSSSSSHLIDLGRLIEYRILDSAPSVREAIIDLVARLWLTSTATCLRRRSLTEQANFRYYYKLLTDRGLDKCTNVRKRAVRAMRDLLLIVPADQTSSYSTDLKASKSDVCPVSCTQLAVDVCAKLSKRIADEDTIRKIVMDLFQQLWFNPHLELSAASATDHDHLMTSASQPVNPTATSQHDVNNNNRRGGGLLDQRIALMGSVTLQFLSNPSDASFDSIVKEIIKATDSSKRDVMFQSCKQTIDRIFELIKQFIQSGCQPTKANTKHHNNKLPPIGNNSTANLLLTRLPSPASNLHLLLALLSALLRSFPVSQSNSTKGEDQSTRIHLLIDLLQSSSVSASSSDSVGGGGGDRKSSVLDVPTARWLLMVLDTMLSRRPRLKSSLQPHLYNLQEVLIRLLQRQGRLLVDTALSCLASLVNNVLRDYTQVELCFNQFYSLLINWSDSIRKALASSSSSSSSSSSCSQVMSSNQLRPSILRSLYSVGLFCKHFDLLHLLPPTDEGLSPRSVRAFLVELVDTLILYARFGSTINNSASSASCLKMRDSDMCHKAVSGLGFVVTRYDDLLTTDDIEAASGSTTKSFLLTFLPPSSDPNATARTAAASHQPYPLAIYHDIQCVVVDFLSNYLLDKERQAMAEHALWSVNSKLESLKELSDRHNSQTCVVVQHYLGPVLDNCIVTPVLSLRRSCLTFMAAVLRQGLVHPNQLVSSLIGLQADQDSPIRSRVGSMLAEIETKTPGFCLTSSVVGIYIAFQLSVELASVATAGQQRSKTLPLVCRGARRDSGHHHSSTITLPYIALNQGLYTLVQSNRKNRRSFVFSLLSLFDSFEAKHYDDNTDRSRLEHVIRTHNRRRAAGIDNIGLTQLAFLAFVTDQLAHFAYATLDDVYYLTYNVDQRVSQLGPSLVASLRALIQKASAALSNRQLDDLLDSAAVTRSTDTDARQPPPTGEETRLISLAGQTAATGGSVGWPACLLLTALRQHLMSCYGITEEKLSDYSPSDSSNKSAASANTLANQPISNKRQSNANLFRVPALVQSYLTHPDWLLPTGGGPPPLIIVRQLVELHKQLMHSSITALNSPMTPLAEPLPTAGPVSLHQSNEVKPSTSSISNGFRSKDPVHQNTEAVSSSSSGQQRRPPKQHHSPPRPTTTTTATPTKKHHHENKKSSLSLKKAKVQRRRLSPSSSSSSSVSSVSSTSASSSISASSSSLTRPHRVPPTSSGARSGPIASKHRPSSSTLAVKSDKMVVGRDHRDDFNTKKKKIVKEMTDISCSSDVKRRIEGGSGRRHAPPPPPPTSSSHGGEVKRKKLAQSPPPSRHRQSLPQPSSRALAPLPDALFSSVGVAKRHKMPTNHRHSTQAPSHLSKHRPMEKDVEAEKHRQRPPHKDQGAKSHKVSTVKTKKPPKPRDSSSSSSSSGSSILPPPKLKKKMRRLDSD